MSDSNNRRRGRRRRPSEDDDDDDDIEYGIRNSRRRTSWEYRDTSSLSVLERMEQEQYYVFAVDMLANCTALLHLIFFLLSHIRTITVLIDSWTVCEDIMSSAIERGQQMIGCCREMINRLYSCATVCKYYSEVAFLYVADLTYFERLPFRFQPERNRTIEDISRRDCYTWFGIQKEDLRRLYTHWRIPDRMAAPRSRNQFDGEACFIICLFHMCKGHTFIDMSQAYFGGDPRYMSMMNEAMINHLYETFFHKISGNSLAQWLPSHLDQCRELIHTKLANGVVEENHYVHGQVVDSDWVHTYFDFNLFRPFGFVDDFSAETARPGDEARRREDYDPDIQRAFYSGYFRRHGLKAQVVYLPIGIIGSVFITEMRHNDNGVQNMSGLNDILLQLLRGFLVGGLFPACESKVLLGCIISMSKQLTISLSLSLLYTQQCTLMEYLPTSLQFFLVSAILPMSNRYGTFDLHQ
jgi:hypothetical protein